MFHSILAHVKMGEGGEVKAPEAPPEPPNDHAALHSAAAEMMTHISKNDSAMFASALKNFIDLHLENKEALESEKKDGIGEE